MWGGSQSEDKGNFTLGFVIGLICGGMMGAFAALGFCIPQADQMRKKCVENGAAHYDSKTGAFVV